MNPINNDYWVSVVAAVVVTFEVPLTLGATFGSAPALALVLAVAPQ